MRLASSHYGSIYSGLESRIQPPCPQPLRDQGFGDGLLRERSRRRRIARDEAAVLLDGVTDLQFAYLDAGGNALGPLPLSPENRDLVRAVNVQLSVEILDENTRTWNTLLALRNDP